MTTEKDVNLDGGEEYAVEGTVESITYQNDENGYTVCRIDTGSELFTAVGYMPGIVNGEYVKLTGKWEKHNVYGEQLKVLSFEKGELITTAAILHYLSSRAIKGVGPALARKIVGRFKEETLDVLENHPEFLVDINGISRKKAHQISEDFKSQFAVRDLMMFTKEYFSPAMTMRMHKLWGQGAVNLIRQNPYLLCDHIEGVSFSKADQFAKILGIQPDDPNRIMAAIKYALSYNASNNGHTMVPRDTVINLVASLLELSEEKIYAPFEELEKCGEVVTEKYSNTQVTYLADYYEAEQYIVKKLTLLERMCAKEPVNDIDRLISQIESEEGIEYAPMQRKAIISAVNSGVMILTGGPGTGKTTIIRAVIRIINRMGLEIALAAPTGRAAKRMSEATGYEAKTIHRLLETTRLTESGRSVFNRDENNLLEADAIIVDETSMVDTLLCQALLKAIKPGARLILIGDADQLPSVGAGNVLCNLIKADIFSTVCLKDVFRQAQESRIVTNAHAINKGELPVLDDKNGDFFFLAREDDSQTVKTIVDLLLYRLPKKYGKDVCDNIQIISPSRKGNVGTEALNEVLQSALNPASPEKRETKFRKVVFRVGDKVMQIKNNYDMEWVRGNEIGCGVFNGDIGIVTDVDVYNKILSVRYDDKTADYDFSQLEELEHAYAVTVHKSQGSEYPIVIMPVFEYSPKLLTRNLLYTAVTRAQKMVIMVGKMQVVQGMVANNRIVNRYSGLLTKLRKAANEL